MTIHTFVEVGRLNLMKIMCFFFLAEPVLP
jgi:hypothetical protein